MKPETAECLDKAEGDWKVAWREMQAPDVVEYTDVMRSWAWGSEPKLRLLRRWKEGSGGP